MAYRMLLLIACAVLPHVAQGARVRQDVITDAGANATLHKLQAAGRQQEEPTIEETLERWRAKLKEKTAGQCVLPLNVIYTTQGCRTGACQCSMKPLYSCYEPPLQYGLAIAGQCAIADWVYIVGLILVLCCCCCACCMRK
uniref:PSI domain-containing protein n=1 Tax=Alexandrium andersonii TaxID=327968 RepID=A0A7S2IH60_9DINO|mmetsp:Transcript_83243/g.185817  ORF Transcript_83243/g.185817 Transcript_83243/m.185817 type:complete len:141 (+) Transcript_83243:116-538(+)